MNKAYAMRGLSIAILAVCAIPASAQLNLPNALIEPVSRKKQDLPDPGARPTGVPSGMPSRPGQNGEQNDIPLPQPSGAPAPSATTAKTEEQKQELALATVRAYFSTYQVSAIVGNTAILRRAGGQTNGAPATANVPALTNGQSVMPASTPAPVPSGSSSRTESMTIKNGARTEFVSSTGFYSAKVSGSRVAIYYEGLPSQTSKKAVLPVLVYAAEIDVIAVTQKPIVLQTKDADTKSAVKVQAGSNGSSSQASSSGAAPQSAPPPMAP